MSVSAPGLKPPPARRAPRGEAQVWLTALGLTLGMGMIAGLLLLILVRGVAVFWPDRVVEFQLKEDGGSAWRGQTVLAGEVVRTQHRRDGGGEEVQVFLANKDAYGANFHWLQSADIVSRREPAGIMKLERLEYGDALGYPVSLRAAEATLAAEDAAFLPTLEAEIKKAAATRRVIKRLEKDEIGAINRKLAQLELQAKTGKAAHYEADKTALQEAYEKLAAEAREHRATLDTATLTYRLPAGEEREVSIGNLLGFYYPNQLGWFGQLGVFFHHGWQFLSDEPREANTEGGIFPALFGTFAMTVLMSLLVTPLGVIAAIYLREYAKQGAVVRLVRICVNNLAGVPSIVFGVFGLGFFVYVLGGKIDSLFFSSALPTPTFGTGGILWASLTLALLALPVVIVATEEALAAVPRGVREAALACGASKWQMIQRVVLPSAAPGVLTGVILAMARGAGEVAPLMLVGVVKLAPTLPIDGLFPFIHPERKFMHLGFHIFDLGFQSPDSEAAKPMVFATTLLLITLVVVMNLAAILLRNHLRRKYAASTF